MPYQRGTNQLEMEKQANNTFGSDLFVLVNR